MMSNTSSLNLSSVNECKEPGRPPLTRYPWSLSASPYQQPVRKYRCNVWRSVQQTLPGEVSYHPQNSAHTKKLINEAFQGNALEKIKHFVSHLILLSLPRSGDLPPAAAYACIFSLDLHIVRAFGRVRFHFLHRLS